jgi:hypothetical protein
MQDIIALLVAMQALFKEVIFDNARISCILDKASLSLY